MRAQGEAGGDGPPPRVHLPAPHRRHRFAPFGNHGQRFRGQYGSLLRRNQCSPRWFSHHCTTCDGIRVYGSSGPAFDGIRRGRSWWCDRPRSTSSGAPIVLQRPQ
ncbi:unnamed protein product, partial [Nesidiocoris tenuis]